MSAMVPEVGFSSAASRLLVGEAGMIISGMIWQPFVFFWKIMP